MALFRKFFYRKPPDGLLEICERVYVFDCCFTTDAWEEENYKAYIKGVIGELRDHFHDASFLVFNFREGETPSQVANVLSEYDLTIMDYPRHYEGCPLLTMEVMHHFLRSSESWLSLGQHNVLLMHCERGGWPVLAFMLAALLIYRKQYTGEQKTLDMIYKQAPRELLQLLSPLNPLPSQLRYLQYVARRNVALEWPPSDRALILDCIMMRSIPNFDGEGGCRPIYRMYGQDPSNAADRTPKVLYSTPKRSKTVRLYKQIDHRRAYNCEIMLSKVKVPLHDLVSSVLALEDSALDVDHVDNLIKFCPTKEEMELLNGYNGEKGKLGKCEQFFLELMQVPRVESKLRVFSFKIQFRSQVFDLRNSLNVVNSAAEEIRNSDKLKRIMQTILSLGNALNQGTARGSAIGFRLDSLLKLTETRARNSKMTLMHYLCKVVADKLPELLDFSKDLTNLEPASKVQLKILAEEMQAISKGLEKVIHELSISENDGPLSENFRKSLKQFLSFAEAEVRSLASLYSVVGRHVDALILYFGEDPSRCQFEQVVSTLLNFARMFGHAHEENCKQLELEKKKADKESGTDKLKIGGGSQQQTGHLLVK